MATDPNFNAVLAGILESVLPGDTAQALMKMALEEHRTELIDIATAEQNTYTRKLRVEGANAKLIEALQGLTDTEHEEPTGDEPTDAVGRTEGADVVDPPKPAKRRRNPKSSH